MKKGFTLVELMGVIVILGVIALITVPVIDKTLKDARDDASTTSLTSIKQAAKLWASDHPFSLPDNPVTSIYSFVNSSKNNNYSCYLNYNTLVDNGYIDTNMIDPKTKVAFNSYNTLITITKDKNNNKYEYDVDFEKNSTSTNASLEKNEHICGDID